MVHLTYFVHCTTTDNEKDLATGQLPGELSTLGLEQSKALRQQTAGRIFDVVFCSDLQRAIDTSNIAFGDSYPIKQDSRLREVDYGDWNGKPDSFKNVLTDYIDQRFPNGEGYRDVEQRLRDFCDFLRREYNDKRVAIVAHQAPQLALDVILAGKTWEQAIAQDWRHTKSWQPGWDYLIP